MIGGGDTAMEDALVRSADYGIAVFAGHTAGAVASAADMIDAVTQFGCATNFNGQLLSSSGAADATALEAAAAGMRSAMHWGVPLVTNVSSVQAAITLAKHGLPLAAVRVPLSNPQAVLDLYAAMRAGIGRDASVAATPASAQANPTWPSACTACRSVVSRNVLPAPAGAPTQ